MIENPSPNSSYREQYLTYNRRRSYNNYNRSYNNYNSNYSGSYYNSPSPDDFMSGLTIGGLAIGVPAAAFGLYKAWPRIKSGLKVMFNKEAFNKFNSAMKSTEKITMDKCK